MENVDFQITVHCKNGTDFISMFDQPHDVIQLEDQSTVKLLETSKSLGLGEHADILKILITLPINTTAVVVGNMIFSKLKAKNKDGVTVVIDDNFFNNAQKLSEHIDDKISKNTATKL